MPDRVSNGSGLFSVRGQITVTVWPAAVSARPSCQTRRSSGTDRFSTTRRTRAKGLPGDADELRRPVGLLGLLVADELDDDLVGAIAKRSADSGVVRGQDA